MSPDPGSREDPDRRPDGDAGHHDGVRERPDATGRGARPQSPPGAGEPWSPGGPSDAGGPWSPGGQHRDPGAQRWGPGTGGPWGPGWAPPQSPEGRSRAETALILGILGVVVLPVLAPFAIWQAREAEKLGVPATAGRVLGWVGTVLLVMMVVFVALWLAVAGFVLVSGAGW